MRLRPLIKALDKYCLLSQIDDFEVKGISCDSGQLRGGFIFVAVRGTHLDGHQFIAEAIAKGAKAVVIQHSASLPVPARPAGGRQAGSIQHPDKGINFIEVDDTRIALAKLAAEFYRDASSQAKVIGITGTNGKTTVSYLIEAIAKEAGRETGVLGTVNYRFKHQVIPAKNTTPGPIELHSILARMLKQGVKYVVMEVSSHALAQERTAGITFNTAVFTNLTQDHLDYHRDMEDYFQAKAKLFKRLDKNAQAIINSDGQYGQRLIRLTKAKVITFAIDGPADITAANIKSELKNTEFILKAGEKEAVITTSLIGRHNIYNILAAVSWALDEGIDLTLVKSALSKFSAVPGRLQMIESGRNFSVFIDYAHTDDALRNVITALRPLFSGRLIVVFGCGGQRDRGKRPKMGRVSSELADYVIITSDNPRSEEPQEIISEVVGGIKKDNYSVVVDRKQAIEKSLSMARSGDIVLVAGKGHETYQILKDQVIPFDDRKVIEGCLNSMSY